MHGDVREDNQRSVWRQHPRREEKDAAIIPETTGRRERRGTTHTYARERKQDAEETTS